MFFSFFLLNSILKGSSHSAELLCSCLGWLIHGYMDVPWSYLTRSLWMMGYFGCSQSFANYNHYCNKWCMWVVFSFASQLKDRFPKVGLLSERVCEKWWTLVSCSPVRRLFSCHSHQCVGTFHVLWSFLIFSVLTGGKWCPYSFNLHFSNEWINIKNKLDHSHFLFCELPMNILGSLRILDY